MDFATKYLLLIINNLMNIKESTSDTILSAITHININTITETRKIIVFAFNIIVGFRIANRINEFIFEIIDKRNRRA